MALRNKTAEAIAINPPDNFDILNDGLFNQVTKNKFYETLNHFLS